ncbi:MAG: VOC family protein [Rhizomicrobium sp.]
MPRFHHANLSITPDNAAAQESFLVEMLGYRRMQLDDRLRSVGARWFEAEDGSQIHLSNMPHVAVEYGAQLPEIEERLRQAEIAFKEGEFAGVRVLFVTDPAGNSWELRGSSPQS